MQMALHHALLPISCLHRKHAACPAAGGRCCTATSPGTKKGDEGERGEMRYHVKYLRAVGVPLQMTRGSNTLPFTAVSPPAICAGTGDVRHLSRFNLKNARTNPSPRSLSCKLDANFNNAPVSLLHCRGLEKLIFCFATDFSGTSL